VGTQPDVEVEIVTTVDTLPPEMWAAENLRPQYSRRRLRDLEADRRFVTRYVMASQGSRVLAILPIYDPHLDRWPDPAYDPSRYVANSSSSPRSWTLAGGRADRASAMLVSPQLSTSLSMNVARAIIVAACGHVHSNGRCLAILHFGADSTPLYESVRDLPAAKAILISNRYVLDDIGRDLESYLGLLPQRHRGIVRRDLIAVASELCWAEPVGWGGIIEEASPLVWEIHKRYGQPDHPLLIADRLQRWETDPDCECIAFVIRRNGRLLGVTFGWIHGQVLELYEIGLAEELGPLRRLAYLELMFYAPLRFGWAHSMRSLDLAFESSRPKVLRGARLIPTYAAVLPDTAKYEA